MTGKTLLAQANPSVKQARRLAVFWGIAGAIATVGVLPYTMALNPMLFTRIHVALPVFVLTQFLQGFVVLILLSWAGLRLGRAIGLESPIAHALMFRTAALPLPKKTLASAVVGGSVAGATLLVMDSFLRPFMPSTVLPTPAGIDLWKRFLACFYGGITEELICRLFLMTLLVWICWRSTSDKGSPPNTWMLWFGIVGAALVFGLGHLPATAMVWPLTPLVVARTLLFNAVGGIVFGWFYCRWGLEHAMVAHFAGDLVLHVVAGI
ncbi:MAG: hypothetical protein JWR07_3368 [Nevskia sp.]|nr:hypothetical protein [Nevskia sp.]